MDNKYPSVFVHPKGMNIPQTSMKNSVWNALYNNDFINSYHMLDHMI